MTTTVNNHLPLELKENMKFLFETQSNDNRIKDHYFDLMKAATSTELVAGLTVSLGSRKMLPPVTLRIAGCDVASHDAATLQVFTFPSSLNDFGKQLFNEHFKIHNPSHLPEAVRDHVLRLGHMDTAELIFKGESGSEMPWVIVTVTSVVKQDETKVSADKCPQH